MPRHFAKSSTRVGGTAGGLDDWLVEYNRTRPHSGKYCYGKTPIQTFLDSVSLAREKMLDQNFSPPRRSRSGALRTQAHAARL